MQRFIKFSTLDLPTWILSDNLGKTQATANAEEMSYAMGKLVWTVSNDTVRCNKGNTYTTALKITSCRDVEFTCSNGDCVSMDQRCDQLPHYLDESDELDYQLLILKQEYNFFYKEVPPITSKEKVLVPVPVQISIRLFKVVDMEEHPSETVR